MLVWSRYYCYSYSREEYNKSEVNFYKSPSKDEGNHRPDSILKDNTPLSWKDDLFFECYQSSVLVFAEKLTGGIKLISFKGKIQWLVTEFTQVCSQCHKPAIKPFHHFQNLPLAHFQSISIPLLGSLCFLCSPFLDIPDERKFTVWSLLVSGPFTWKNAWGSTSS